ncbi:MAG: outer membrane protein assembly factor BamE [Thioalkalivibrionaceae bacterium]
MTPALGLTLGLGAASSLAGCSLASGFRLDVQQGNALDAERVDQLQVGMTERQVLFLLGSPAITAAFREGERWDYVYFRRPGIGRSERAKLTIHFENGRVARIQKPQSEPRQDSIAYSDDA